MKLAQIIVFSVLGAIVSWLAANLAFAQAAQEMRTDTHGNQYSPLLSQLSAINNVEQWTSFFCSRNVYEVEQNVPTGTGSERVDHLLAVYMAQELERLKRESFFEISECPRASTRLMSYSRKFAAYSPSPNSDILSILFNIDIGQAGSDGERHYSESALIRLSDGKLLDLVDIFPNYRASAQVLWDEVVKGWCEHPDNKDKVLPDYYSLPSRLRACDPSGRTPIPRAIWTTPSSFQGFGPVYFTPEGMTIHLRSWNRAWDPNAAPPEVKIGKEALVEMGVDPRIWDSKKEKRPDSRPFRRRDDREVRANSI